MSTESTRCFILSNEWGEPTAGYRWTGECLRNNRLKFKSSEKFTDRFRGIYRIFLKSIKETPKVVNMEPVGLGNTRILTDYGQKSPLDTDFVSWQLAVCYISFLPTGYWDVWNRECDRLSSQDYHFTSPKVCILHAFKSCKLIKICKLALVIESQSISCAKHVL